MGKEARTAPKDASKEARKLENWLRLPEKSENLAQREQKNERSANVTLNLDLIRTSLAIRSVREAQTCAPERATPERIAA